MDKKVCCAVLVSISYCQRFQMWKLIALIVLGGAGHFSDCFVALPFHFN